MPPDTAMVIFPVGLEQLEFVIPETKAEGDAGAARFILLLPVQPWLSVMTTEKFPDPKLLAVAPVPPEGDH